MRVSHRLCVLSLSFLSFGCQGFRLDGAAGRQECSDDRRSRGGGIDIGAGDQDGREQ